MSGLLLFTALQATAPGTAAEAGFAQRPSPSTTSSSAASASLAAEQAMANYRQILGAGNSLTKCEHSDQEILVCGRLLKREPRLPLPDERFEPGEVVGRKGEASPATDAFRGPPSVPSRLGETIGKAVNLAKALITGADANPEP